MARVRGVNVRCRLAMIVLVAAISAACGGGEDTLPCLDVELHYLDGAPVGCLHAFDAVAKEPSDVPASGSADAAWWVPTYCTNTSDACHGLPGAPCWACPGLFPELGCYTIQEIGTAGGWLTVADAGGGSTALGAPPLMCVSCPPTDHEGECGCTAESLGNTWVGLAGATCDVLLVPGAAGPIVVRTAADLATAFAPVETAEEALAFAEIVAPRVQHRFWSGVCGTVSHDCDGYQNVPTHVHSWQEWDVLGCLEEDLSGTWVEPAGDDWLVHTWRVPGQNGCEWVLLEHADVRVARAGDVTIVDTWPGCFGDIPCYD